MADGEYRGNPEMILPYRKPGKGREVAERQEKLNTVHKRVSARVEHALAHMKSWNILPNCRRERTGVWHATLGWH
jgi:hypothetical protein